MKHQNGHSSSPPVAVAHSMRQLAHDVVELAELQTAMVKLELKDWWKQLVTPVALLLVALLLAISVIPVLLVSAAYGLDVWTELGFAWCLLIVGAISLVTAVVIGWIGYRSLKAAHLPLEESRREFSQNVRWIKSVLQHRARPSQVIRSMHEAN